MLIDFQYHTTTRNLLLSIINEKGDLEIKKYIWEQPYKYVTCLHDDVDRELKYTSWDKKPIKKILSNNPDRYSVYEFIDFLPKEEREKIYGYAIPNIYFIDIETASDEHGYSTVEDARCEIQTISIVYDDKIIVLGTKELGRDSEKKIIRDTNEYVKKYDKRYQFKYINCKTEFDMLKYFFEKMLVTMPCITGWNFLDYDWRYLVNRAKKIEKHSNFGDHIKIKLSECSPTKKFEPVFGTVYEMPMHKLIYDYMEIYKKLDTSIKIKESNSLDFVSENILGLKKIKVVDSKGNPISLLELYETDFERFVYYNTIDSVLVQLIHNKMRYIEIIFGISAIAKISAMDTFSVRGNGIGSLAITEGVLRDRFREMHNVIFFKDRNKQPNLNSGISIEGGYVKEPVRGMNRWVACYDFASLYPTTQRQFFISPENYIGMLDMLDSNYFVDFLTTAKKLVNTSEMVVLSNSCVFLKQKSATIDMLESVYKERKADKKISLAERELMEAKIKQLDVLKKEIEMEM